MSASPEEVRALLAAVEASEWDEVSIVVDGLTLQMSRSSPHPSWAGAATAAPAAAPVVAPALPAPGPAPGSGAPRATPPEPAPAPPPEPAPAPAPGGEPATTGPGTHLVVDSPSLGIVWRSPKPGAPPFVEVGDPVDPGDTLCIVEVMKLMHQVKATATGRVTDLHVENGQMVEFGHPLVTLSVG